MAINNNLINQLLSLKISSLLSPAVDSGILPSGLKLQLDATTGVTSSGNLVSNWADQTTQGNDVAQAIMASRPATNSNNLNGKNVLTFDGTNVIGSGTSTFTGGEAPRTLAIMARPTADTNFANIFVNGSSANDSGFVMFMVDSSGDVAIGSHNGALAQSTTQVLNSPNRLIGSYGGSADRDYEITVNGTKEATTSDSAPFLNISSGGLTVGSNTTGGQFYLGDIAEILMWDRKLTDPEITQVDTYFKDKWMPLAMQTPGLVTWIDAQTISTINTGSASDNDPIDNINDKSGAQENAVQTIGTAKPTFKTGTVNRMQFDGSSDYLTVGTESSYDFTSQFDIFVVVDMTVLGGAFRTVIGKGDTTFRLNVFNSENKWRFDTGSGGASNTILSTSTITLNQRYLLNMKLGGGTKEFFIDGVSQGTASIANLIPNNFPCLIGENAESGGRFWNGNIYEAIIYNRGLNGTERTNLTTSLKTKYNIT